MTMLAHAITRRGRLCACARCAACRRAKAPRLPRKPWRLGYRAEHGWLAGALPARRLERVEGQPIVRPAAEVDRARAARD